MEQSFLEGGCPAFKDHKFQWPLESLTCKRLACKNGYLAHIGISLSRLSGRLDILFSCFYSIWQSVKCVVTRGWGLLPVKFAISNMKHCLLVIRSSAERVTFYLLKKNFLLWYVRVRIRGYEMLVFLKILRTY